jgi:antitoxin component YwqK of YwqJK toxin-antitoxin module
MIIFNETEYLICESELGIELKEIPQQTRVQRLFFENGALQSECYYRDNQLHGPSRFFSEEGILLAETWFWLGRRQGIARMFYQSGAPYAILRFRNDRKIQKQEYFYENSQLKTIEEYLDGRLHGESVLYWPNGQCKRRCHFDHGKRCGVDQIWNEAGAVLHEEVYARS